ncbi:MAG: DUF302 domain-containing protein [Bacteroidales bacterium]|jgi:uncharacterized protein (DUF302 family)|nr:DUF302 domain-containing protein [Bacteroidales bacterium]
MKIQFIFTIIILSVSMMANAQNTPGQNPVMIENESRYDFAATVDTLSDIIVSGGWKVITLHDLQETMKKNGKEVLPVKVMEICNPNLAYQILSRDELRDASPMLPCRISVYEKADGKTYVSRINAPAFAGMIGGDAAKTIVEAFEAAEGFLKPVIR